MRLDNGAGVHPWELSTAVRGGRRAGLRFRGSGIFAGELSRIGVRRLRTISVRCLSSVLGGLSDSSVGARQDQCGLDVVDLPGVLTFGDGHLLLGDDLLAVSQLDGVPSGGELGLPPVRSGFTVVRAIDDQAATGYVRGEPTSDELWLDFLHGSSVDGRIGVSTHCSRNDQEAEAYADGEHRDHGDTHDQWIRFGLLSIAFFRRGMSRRRLGRGR